MDYKHACEELRARIVSESAERMYKELADLYKKKEDTSDAVKATIAKHKQDAEFANRAIDDILSEMAVNKV